MKRDSRARMLLILFILPVFCCMLLAAPAVQETPVAEKTQEIQSQGDPQAAPGPKTQQERIGLYVFLGWVWLTIIVLIYFLRLKIIESDRLYGLDYYRDAGEDRISARQ